MASRHLHSRNPNTKVIRHRAQGTALVQPHEPSTPDEASITAIVVRFRSSRRNINPIRDFISEFGGLQPGQLEPAHVIAIVNGWQARVSRATKSTYVAHLKAWLTKLRPYGVSAACVAAIPKQEWRQPRNVTVTPGDLETILVAASPALRLYVLLCHDCALRSSSAVQAGPGHYDGQRRTLTMVTKGGEPVVLPVTERLHEALQPLMSGGKPFVAQLMPSHHRAAWKSVREKMAMEWVALKLALNLPPGLRLHDFRRTMARNMYAITGDVRAAQAILGHASPLTTWRYLDQHVKAISVAAAQESAANWKGKNNG